MVIGKLGRQYDRKGGSAGTGFKVDTAIVLPNNLVAKRESHTRSIAAGCEIGIENPRLYFWRDSIAGVADVDP